MATMMETVAEAQVKSCPKQEVEPKGSSKNNLFLGLVFGFIFGFLLQKGGVGKYHVLIGQLLLQDYTVVKVMMSAVFIGMLGIHIMHRFGLVKLHIKPTRYAANIIGGLLFGVGFALAAYCPGTGAAALGQGNYDALSMMIGMVGGSFLFAQSSGWISKHIEPVGERGKLTLHDVIPINKNLLVILCASIIFGILLAIESLT